MKAIDDELGIGAMVFDSFGVGAAHVAAGPGDIEPLLLAEFGVEKLVDGRSPFTETDPYDNRAIEVINNGRELAALTVGDFVNAKSDKAAYLMAFAYAGDDAMQDIRQRGCRHFQDLGRCFLGHNLAE